MPNEETMTDDYDHRVAVYDACQRVLAAEQRYADALVEAKDAAHEYESHAHELTDAFGLKRPVGPWDEGSENHSTALDCRLRSEGCYRALDTLLAMTRTRAYRIRKIAEQAALEGIE